MDFLRLKQDLREGRALARPQREAPEPLRFSFDGEPVRVVLRAGEPWWVAADVLARLGLDRTSLERLDEDERGTRNVSTTASAQQMTVISEPGLYRVVFLARTERAEPFRRWVTHDVLPAIRKTGRYESAPQEPAFPVPRTLPEALRLAADLAERVEQQAAQLEAQAPAVEAHERLQASRDALRLRDALAQLGLPEQDTIQRLVKEGILYRATDERLRAKAEHLRADRFRYRQWTADVPSADGSYRSGPQLLVTQVGLSWLATRYPLKRGAEQGVSGEQAIPKKKETTDAHSRS